MKHTFSRSFATRLSIYVLSFTLIIFATIMALFYYYSHQKVTDFAIERTHGLLSNIATEISGQLLSVETTIANFEKFTKKPSVKAIDNEIGRASCRERV